MKKRDAYISNNNHHLGMIVLDKQSNYHNQIRPITPHWRHSVSNHRQRVQFLRASSANNKQLKTWIKGHARGPVTWSAFAYRHVILACPRLERCRLYFLHGIMQMFPFYIHCVDVNEPWTTTKRNGHPYRLSIMCLSLMCHIYDG